MILQTVLVFSFVCSFSVSFNFLKRRARLKVGLLASLIASLLSTLFILFFSFLWSGDWKFYLGLVVTFFLVVVCLVELLLRIAHRGEVQLSLADNYLKEVSGGLQLRAVAFFYSFKEVSSLNSVMQDKYLTKEFWEELTKYRKSGMFDRGKDRQILGNKDVFGKYINVYDGLRVTPNQLPFATKKILLFGGSNIISYEVQDDKTPSAFLQNKIIDHGFNYKVENHGVGGASIGDCLRRLKLVDLDQNDIVVFWFGDNDIGINLPRKLIGKSVMRKVPYSGEIVTLYKKKLEIMNQIYLKCFQQIHTDLTVSQGFLNNTIQKYDEITKFLKAKNINFIFFLQPNLFTKKSKNLFESWISDKYPAHWGTIVAGGYAVLEQRLCEDKNFELATNIFDNYSDSFYLDWSHVNSHGNEIIAQRILSSLLDRGLLMSDSSPNL